MLDGGAEGASAAWIDHEHAAFCIGCGGECAGGIPAERGGFFQRLGHSLWQLGLLMIKRIWRGEEASRGHAAVDAPDLHMRVIARCHDKQGTVCADAGF